VLGDNPVQIITKRDRKFEEDGVIDDPASQLVFPISKQRTFVGSADLNFFQSVSSDKRVSLVNSAQIYGAHKHVYGSNEMLLREAFAWREAAYSMRSENRCDSALKG
jgi:hypothetical protein